MVLTNHAIRRLRQRFPELVGVGVLEQWELAQGRRATPEQALEIRRSCRRATPDHRYLVSPRGGVFVAAEGDVVVTVFALPRRVRPIDAGRRRLRLRDEPRGEARRGRELRACWRRLLEDD